MELLGEEEINEILKSNFGTATLIRKEYKEFDEKVIGYLGDHVKLILEVENYECSEIRLFVKCMPRNDEWKSNYLKELGFFMKEYVMLSSLFREFHGDEGKNRWRPKLYYIREDLFVFEDVSELSFEMPFHRETLSINDIRAAVQTLARFHAASYILEERKSKKLGKPYRIWDDYSEYLQEPTEGIDWRNTGRNAVIDFLKLFSDYKSTPNFEKKLELIIPMLYDGAWALMKPSIDYRNVVVHRDLWTNNMFIRHRENNEIDVLFVDFQTVLYCSPMLDLTSLIYFNTTKTYREKCTADLMNMYHLTLESSLEEHGIDVNEVFPKDVLLKSYKESLMFGMTQAALIVPIIAMDSETREEIFCNPEKCVKANVVSRSEEIIEVARKDGAYRERVRELLDDIVETFVLSGSAV